MKTQVNGREREFPAEVQAKWDAFVEGSGLDFTTVTSINYFYPRPYRNEYDIGSHDEGFVYVLGTRDVCLKVIKSHHKAGGDEPMPAWLEDAHAGEQ